MNDLSLTLPHPRMNERNFVLTPLSDMNENVNVSSNINNECITQLLPLSDNEDFYEIDNNIFTLKHRTLLMGIINITPDSFSDGGKYYDNKNRSTIDINSILSQIDSMINDDCVDIIDIGGQSTRPGAKMIDKQEEMDRILPAIEHVKECFPNIIVSVDTTDCNVAKEAVLSGKANIVNDISGGLGHLWKEKERGSINDDNIDNIDDFDNFESPMYDVISKLNCPYILNHIRGNPCTMQKNVENLEYSNGIINDLNIELSKKVNCAIKKYGILRWNIIVDPGIGFAKKFQDNVKICCDSNGINNLKPHAS